MWGLSRLDYVAIFVILATVCYFGYGIYIGVRIKECQQMNSIEQVLEDQSYDYECVICQMKMNCYDVCLELYYPEQCLAACNEIKLNEEPKMEGIR